ncbi:MAG: hypothetical protein JWP01_481 [Myxococcales bacterium]|nr:hypothetical protein [Myxococcales bacterium]
MWRKLFGVGALSVEGFAKLVAEIAVARGEMQLPVIDLDKMEIVDGKRVINLTNLYTSFLGTPRRKRIAFIENVIRMPEIPATWAEVQQHLMPVLRDGAYLTIAELSLAARGETGEARTATIARQPLVPGLFVTLVIDAGEVMSIVQDRQLREWGVDLTTALEIAMTNLRAVSQDTFSPLAPGLWVSPWSDCYGAARLVLPEIVQRVCTDPLVCVPNRDTLLIADPRDREAFFTMVGVIGKLSEDEHYPISRRIFQLENKSLRMFEPPADHPVTKVYQRLLVEEQARCYAHEKDLREQIEDEDDAFYGSLMVFETPDRDLITRAVWTEGIDVGYLPPAQMVSFFKPDDPKHQGAWDVPWAIAEAEPGLLTRTDRPLPRWRVGTFPSIAWLDQHGTKLDGFGN